jgi:hypothetical protein
VVGDMTTLAPIFFAAACAALAFLVIRRRRRGPKAYDWGPLE